MATCEVCGNDYDQTLTISIVGGAEHVFDSFECAIARLAPACPHCDCRVIGHGIQVADKVYCCAHCARAEGHVEPVDHV